jgi:two-component system phosphate regulon sensor histidine kinase PhoR
VKLDEGELRLTHLEGPASASSDGVLLRDRDGQVLTWNEVVLHQTLAAQQAEIEELRRVDALKDEFLATVSHELRTPLTSIVGFAEVLTQVVPEQESLIAPIERNAHDMRRLVEGLLDQARLESGKVTIRPTLFELAPAVQALIDELSPVPADVRIEIPGHLQISMDREAFSRVLGNLVGNATKYAAGSPITISAERSDGHVSVSVTDEGPGIAPSDQEQLFDPFFRAQGASRTARGSGFGLSIVRRYLELHGGDIVCRSSLGHGSTFTFRVPVEPALRP